MNNINRLTGGIAGGIAEGTKNIAGGIAGGTTRIAGGIAGGTTRIAGGIVGGVTGGITGVATGVAGVGTLLLRPGMIGTGGKDAHHKDHGEGDHLGDDEEDDDEDEYHDDDHQHPDDMMRQQQYQQQQRQRRDDSSQHSSQEDDEDEEFLRTLDGKAKHIVTSAGTNRLNRILRKSGKEDEHDEKNEFDNYNDEFMGMDAMLATTATTIFEKPSVPKCGDPKNLTDVAHFCARIVIPPLKIHTNSIGGRMLDGYPDTILHEVLFIKTCQFEITGEQTVVLQALQYPNDYIAHKRALGIFTSAVATNNAAAAVAASSKSHKAQKISYVLIARSTNRPVVKPPKATTAHNRQKLQQQQQQTSQDHVTDKAAGGKNATTDHDDTERADYDAMFAPDGDDDDDASRSLHSNASSSSLNADISPLPAGTATTAAPSHTETKTTSTTTATTNNNNAFDAVPENDSEDPDNQFPEITSEDDEISSFPVLICFNLLPDGTGPDIRKLIPLDTLTTVQDLSATVAQLAFANGDTIRLDFAKRTDAKTVEKRPLDKEEFLFGLFQIHAMLCTSVVERYSNGYLPMLNIRNLDRAELSYVATVNGFVKHSTTLKVLLERQRQVLDQESSSAAATAQQQQQQQQSEDAAADNEAAFGRKKKLKDSTMTASSSTTKTTPKTMEVEEMDSMAYDLLMGNLATRVTMFYSEEERKDAEEILNAPEFTQLLLSSDESNLNSTMNIAERLQYVLQARMRDLEAETCRRLIAWEDEKHLSFNATARSKLHDASDSRDTVDALALASLFKTLESLDSELQAMEEFLQDRAAAIKPLTDDCADIEEENRQLEQQWKSYDMLGAEMKRLLLGYEIDPYTEELLKNPASALVYDDNGLVDVDESDEGIDKIYEAGKTLLESIEFVREALEFPARFM
jgi:hypothetical protein